MCITHLPQIAAAGDAHFRISKSVAHGRTQTRVVRLNQGERVEELARMMGGAVPTDASRAAARELLGESETNPKGESETLDRTQHRARSRGQRAGSPESLNMKFFIETYGCQMNVHDSERMAGLLEQAGYEPTSDARDADVVVINTCSVRERAEEKLYTRLGEIRHARKKAGGPQWSP